MAMGAFASYGWLLLAGLALAACGNGSASADSSSSADSARDGGPSAPPSAPALKTSIYIAEPSSGADGASTVAVKRINAPSTICYDDTAAAPAQPTCAVTQFDYSPFPL